MFEIRHSCTQDLARMLEIYAYAREQMKRNGNPNQWITYPERCLLEEDIRRGISYIVESDGEIRGTFVFVTGDDPSYAVIENGAWLNELPYGTIHRIASDGSRKGILAAAVDFGFKSVGEIRIDTHGDNRVMQNALAQLGFTRCGTIYCIDDMSDHSPRIAYQKSKEREHV